MLILDSFDLFIRAKGEKLFPFSLQGQMRRPAGVPWKADSNENPDSQVM